MRLLAVPVWISLLGLLPSQDTGSGPDVGDPAPDFQLRATDGQVYSLQQFRGKKPVVLAWFPKAFTAG